MSCSDTITNLCVWQNATFRTAIQLTDATGSYIDLASWSFTGSIKENIQATTTVVNFSCSIINYTTSIVEIALTPQNTGLLTRKKYVYDIIATNIATTPPEVYRVLAGDVNVDLGVTDS